MAANEETSGVLHPDDIDPGHIWDKAVPAPGHNNVDFDERVNFGRLHEYRLARLVKRFLAPMLNQPLHWQ